MNRVTFAGLTALALLFCFSRSASAKAGDGRTCPGGTPTPNAANILLRKFNDCPTSTLDFTNSYPASISMSETMSGCSGFANLHTWSFSTDGGQTEATFENCSAYEFCATLVITGTGNAEGGLRLSPWWDPDASGLFYVHTGTGEIACVGGRLPFYSFTNAHGVTYTKGVTAFMKIIYTPHALSAAMPATIEYRLSLGGGPLLTSGPLPFAQGTPSEDPPHGLWGELVPAYAGGFFMPLVFSSPSLSMNCQWSNICYQALPAITIADQSVIEGNSGTTSATFNVSMPVSSDTVKVTYSTQDGTATSAGNDYQPTSGLLVFAPGQTSQPINVPVLGNRACEPDETFLVNLTYATSAVIADAQAVGTITNDDSQGPPLPANGISWWRAQGDGSDELNGNTLVAQNGAGIAGGKIGQAFVFDGVDDYYTVPDNPSLQPRNLTLEGWFRLEAPAGGGALVSKTLGPVNNASLSIYTLSGNLTAGVGDLAGFSGLSTAFSPAPGTWHHIAYTFDDDGNTNSLYVDGTLAASGVNAKTIAYDNHPLVLGGRYQNGVTDFLMAGRVDEVTLYDRALTSAEVNDIYSDVCGRPTSSSCIPQPAGSAAWWRAEGSGSDVVSGNTLTLQNGAGFGGGRVGQSLSFDGIDDYASAADSPSLRPHNFTLEGWVRFDRGGAGYDETLVSKQVGAGSLRSFQIDRNATALSATVSDLVELDSVEFPFTPTAGVWYHVAYVYNDNSGTHRLYLDGVLRALHVVPISVAYDNHPVLLGSDGTGRFLDGALDELTLYDRALPAATIDSLYHAYRFGKCLATVDVMNPAMVLDAGALRFEPTPFSGVGRAAFELAERSYVDLAVYDVAGRCVAVLAGQEFEAGPHERPWDGRDMRGQDVVTGVYLLRLRTRGVRTHQMTTRTVTAVRVR